MKHICAIFGVLLFALCANLDAANITGTFKLPNTALTLNNATVTFLLNQAAIVPGSFAIVPASVSCYTSTDGSIKGLPNPLVAPSVTNNTMAGSIAAATYYVRITYTGSAVETLVSPVQSTVLAGTGQIVVTGPVSQPAGATGYNVYIGTVNGSEKLQATTTGFGTTTVTSYNGSAAAAPATNNSVCSLQFNDAMTPAPTTYKVSLVDVNGFSVPGFPQQWYLAGSAFDVSNGYPVAVNVQTRFPQPLIANPSSNALQSINSPLTTNGYDMKIGAHIFTGIASHALSASGTADMWYDTTQNKLLVSVNGAAAVDVLTLAPSLPLTQLQGGTNRSSVITANQLVYSDGSAYQGTSNLTWDNSKVQLTSTGRFILKSATQSNPASDSGSLQMYYNQSGDNAVIYASSNDGSGGGTGKSFTLLGGTLTLSIGSPSSFATAVAIDGSKNTTFSGNVVMGSNNIQTGTNSAASGVLRLANTNAINSRNAANGADINLISTDASNNVVLGDGTNGAQLQLNGTDIKFGKALVAIGATSTVTLGKTGGSGPATIAQDTWMRWIDSAGNAFWVPVWK